MKTSEPVSIWNGSAVLPDKPGRFFFQGKRESGWTGTLTPRLPNRGKEGPPDRRLILDQHWNGFDSIPNFSMNYNIFGKQLYQNEHFSPFEFTSAGIKIGV